MKIAWLFPGQGTQTVSMGKALYDSSKSAREIFDRADAALGFSLSKLCFEGPESELTLTKNTQPAIVTTSMAALAALREAAPDLPDPACAAGHSLGEYSALIAAGALSFEDAVRLVRLRGQAMQDAVPAGAGAMAAIIGGDSAAVSALCADAADGEVLSPANFNAPGQIVIAGTASAVRRAAELAPARKLKAIMLNVSAPFHCALMAPAARAVAEALSPIAIATPRFPIVANVTAEPNADPGRVKDLLVRQMDGAVLWEPTIREMAAAGVQKALEIGPGKVLSGLTRKTEKSISVVSVGDPEGVRQALEALQETADAPSH